MKINSLDGIEVHKKIDQWRQQFLRWESEKSIYVSKTGGMGKSIKSSLTRHGKFKMVDKGWVFHWQKNHLSLLLMLYKYDENVPCNRFDKKIKEYVNTIQR